MASANIKKLHGNEARKILGHNSRWDGKQGVDYDNAHVDPDRTHLNSVMYYRSVMDATETSKQAYERLTARVRELDKLHPPRRVRKDRVTLIAMEIPVPVNLLPEQEQQYFSIAYQEFAAYCGGKENISKLYIHRDEVHEYVDPATKEIRTSRVHAHAVGIPWTSEHGVNAKNACSKERFHSLQQAIHNRCERELGIQFMDGTGVHSHATVEQLKTASTKASMALEQQLREQAKQAQITLKIALDALERARADKYTLEAEKRKIEQSISDCDRRAGEAYDRMIKVLKDENYLREHTTIIDMLKDYYPDTWNVMCSVDFDTHAIERETIEQAPSITLEEIYNRISLLLSEAPSLDDIYPKRSHHSHDDHDGR